MLHVALTLVNVQVRPIAVLEMNFMMVIFRDAAILTQFGERLDQY